MPIEQAYNVVTVASNHIQKFFSVSNCKCGWHYPNFYVASDDAPLTTLHVCLNCPRCGNPYEFEYPFSVEPTAEKSEEVSA